jgi:hypothetical protein
MEHRAIRRLFWQPHGKSAGGRIGIGSSVPMASIIVLAPSTSHSNSPTS